MKFSSCCDRSICYYFGLFSVCINLLLGGMVYYSYNDIPEWRETTMSLLRTNDSNVVEDSKRFKLREANPMFPTLSEQSQQYGYVLPYQLYEQQTSSARNLWGLQYWANTVGIKVVEPFFTDHLMSFEAVVHGMADPMRFSDIYDRNYWNKQSTMRNCSELVTWEEFISDSPRSAILLLVQGYKPELQQAVNGGMIKVVTDRAKVEGSCSWKEVKFPKKALSYFKAKGFNFIRQVCIAFNSSTPMTMQKFSHYIFDSYKPDNITVFVAHWQGIRKNRINLQGVTLENENTVELGLLPSKKILEDSKKYMTHLGFGNDKYFGVMVRIEKLFRNLVLYKNADFDTFMNRMLECAADFKSLKIFKTHRNWKRTLAVDLGRLGSYGFRKQLQKMTLSNRIEEKLYSVYFTSVFGNNSWSIEEFESSFEKHVGSDNPTYTAQIQRTIAALSDCLVLVGGGSTFQDVAISFYKYYHPDVQQQCIIKHCYYGKNFNLNLKSS